MHLRKMKSTRESKNPKKKKDPKTSVETVPERHVCSIWY